MLIEYPTTNPPSREGSPALSNSSLDNNSHQDYSPSQHEDSGRHQDYSPKLIGKEYSMKLKQGVNLRYKHNCT